MEHTEQEVLQTEEQPIIITKKKPTYSPEALENKRISMNKAREHRNKKMTELKEEVETLKTEINKPVVVEPKKKKIITRYEEEEDDEDEEIIERVIIRKKKPTQQKYEEPILSRNDLVEKTYKEQLRAQLNEERRKQVMAELFDF